MPLPHGRFTRVNGSCPEAVGRCDRSGFIFNRVDLQWQYQWGGQSLINLQLLIGPQYIDEPNEQLRSIILPPDPLPIFQPRVDQPMSVDEA